MTPLRQRLIDDLRLRNYSPRTIEAYVSRIAHFARHFGRSPDQLGMEEVRAYQLHLVDQKASWSRFNQTVCALRFLFGTTLGRPEQVPLIAFGKRQHTLPSVLAPEEVVRLFEALPAGRLRLRFQVVYACGLRLGAQIGVLLVLHTWGQNLHHHPHVHGVVTGGGLSCNAQGIVDPTPRWVSCRPGFFLPVRILSRVFRGKYLDALRQAFDQGKLTGWSSAEAFRQWLSPLYAKEWVVYAKPPFGGPERVLKYLARYTHRVAISNHRLVSAAEGRVTFRYKDYADDHHQKTMSLSGEEFLRRFVQHVLPRGFVKMRHYGLLANRHREERLEVCRRLLLLVTTAALLASAATPEPDTKPIEPTRVRSCPKCGSLRLLLIEVPKGGAIPPAGETS